MFETGQPDTGMRALIKGTARLSRRDGLGRTQLPVELTDGQFLGETAQLTRTPALADGHAVTDIEALLIPPHGIRALLVAEVLLGEAIIQSYILRRVRMVRNGSGPVPIGSAENLKLVAPQGLLQRISHPHSVVDAATNPGACAFLEVLDTWKDDLPIVILADGTVMRSPNESQLAMQSRGLSISMAAGFITGRRRSKRSSARGPRSRLLAAEIRPDKRLCSFHPLRAGSTFSFAATTSIRACPATSWSASHRFRTPCCIP